ncbi:MAG: DNA repair protein RecO [bacterium]|nr:DNA repair protein RecO [bacterium]
MRTTPAVVLKSTPWQETDRVVSMFTPEYGRIRGIARGGSRSRKRFGAGLDPLTHIQMHFRSWENRDLVRLEFCEPIETFTLLRNEVLRFGMGFYFAEIIGGLFPEREANPEVFELLLWGLQRLELCDDPHGLARKFEIKVISMAGYHPQSGACRVCGKGTGGKTNFRFLLEAGEIICPDCYNDFPGPTITGESVAILNRVPTLGWEGLNRLRISPRVIEELDGVISDYIRYHTGGKFRSKTFIESIRHGGTRA